jgi:hypothetical protein
MLNIIQYTLLAIIPIILLNKSISKYVPEADEKKGSLEITAELVIQIIVMFIGLLIIHRIITFVPTYSKVEYPEFSIIYIIMVVLMITMSLKTKIGEKVNILIERVVEIWEGKSSKKNGKNGAVKVSQPISGQMSNQSTSMISQNPAASQSLYTDGTAISSLPTNDTSSMQQLPNYNNMYQQNITPLVGASTPGQPNEGFGTMVEPMAANAALGGGFGSAW